MPPQSVPLSLKPHTLQRQTLKPKPLDPKLSRTEPDTPKSPTTDIQTLNPTPLTLQAALAAANGEYTGGASEAFTTKREQNL